MTRERVQFPLTKKALFLVDEEIPFSMVGLPDVSFLEGCLKHHLVSIGSFHADVACDVAVEVT